MDKLLAFLKTMEPEDRADFARRCLTTEAYLRKAVSVKQPLGEGLCLRIGAESGGAVMPEDLRPDVDWKYLRTALANVPAATVQPAIEVKAPELSQVAPKAANETAAAPQGV